MYLCMYVLHVSRRPMVYAGHPARWSLTLPAEDRLRGRVVYGGGGHAGAAGRHPTPDGLVLEDRREALLTFPCSLPPLTFTRDMTVEEHSRHPSRS